MFPAEPRGSSNSPLEPSSTESTTALQPEEVYTASEAVDGPNTRPKLYTSSSAPSGCCCGALSGNGGFIEEGAVPGRFRSIARAVGCLEPGRSKAAAALPGRPFLPPCGALGPRRDLACGCGGSLPNWAWLLMRIWLSTTWDGTGTTGGWMSERQALRPLLREGVSVYTCLSSSTL